MNRLDFKVWIYSRSLTVTTSGPKLITLRENWRPQALGLIISLAVAGPSCYKILTDVIIKPRGTLPEGTIWALAIVSVFAVVSYSWHLYTARVRREAWEIDGVRHEVRRNGQPLIRFAEVQHLRIRRIEDSDTPDEFELRIARKDGTEIPLGLSKREGDILQLAQAAADLLDTGLKLDE